MTAKGLTPGHERFVDELLIDMNATRAYRAAFPESSYQSARVLASRPLAKVNIKKEIAARRAALQRRTRVRAAAVIREVACIAYADPLYLYRDDGTTPRNIRDVPPETRSAIASVKVRRERVRSVTRRRGGEGKVECTERFEVIEYRLHSKSSALDKLWLHLGLSTAIPPLDVLLNALPRALSEQVRRASPGRSST